MPTFTSPQIAPADSITHTAEKQAIAKNDRANAVATTTTTTTTAIARVLAGAIIATNPFNAMPRLADADTIPRPSRLTTGAVARPILRPTMLPRTAQARRPYPRQETGQMASTAKRSVAIHSDS